jgi:hypothetical protein
MNLTPKPTGAPVSMHLGTPVSVGRIDQRAASFRLDAPVCGNVNETLAADEDQAPVLAPARLPQ